MRSQRILTISTPIPANIPLTIVLATLKSFTPLISNHIAADSFQEIRPHPDQTADDPFFPPWDDTVRAFKIREHINMAPGLYKEVNYQNVFQAAPAGARFRANAPAGVVVRAEVVVRPRRSRSATTPISPTGSDSSGSSGTVETEEYELYDEVTLEANSLVMPFIAERTQTSHVAICERIVAKARKDYINGEFMT